jgi:hypothetical protein
VRGQLARSQQGGAANRIRSKRMGHFGSLGGRSEQAPGVVHSSIVMASGAAAASRLSDRTLRHATCCACCCSRAAALGVPLAALAGSGWPDGPAWEARVATRGVRCRPAAACPSVNTATAGLAVQHTHACKAESPKPRRPAAQRHAAACAAHQHASRPQPRLPAHLPRAGAQSPAAGPPSCD